jgi:hypothetical protein
MLKRFTNLERNMPLKLEPKLQDRLSLSPEEIAQLCQQWGITDPQPYPSKLS